MSLLSKIQKILHMWFPNKIDDKDNFDDWINTLMIYENGIFAIPILWKPSLNGETGANYQYSYSESDGVAIGKGFIFHNGFPNTSEWKLSFEFKHDNIRYTGILFLCNADTYTMPSSNFSDGSDSLRTWEGSWLGGERYATYSSGEVGWFDVTVTKIDSTHVRLQSTTLNRDTTVEVSWLPLATRLSFGTVHNSSSSDFGACRIRNVMVTL